MIFIKWLETKGLAQKDVGPNNEQLRDFIRANKDKMTPQPFDIDEKVG
jgi:hypothetical protein